MWFGKDGGMRPMLATRGTTVPTGPEWRHEVKWDGMRIIADCQRRASSGRPGVRLTSRNENDVSVSFPELQGLVGRDLLLDGEVVALRDGRPSFGALQERMHVTNARRAIQLVQRRPVTYLVFDVLRVDGRDLSGEPLAVRRELLDSLDLLDPHWQVPPWYDDGPMLMRATDQQELEGVVSKRLSSRYEPGTRSPHWLKFAHRRRTSWVVGGWRLETDSTSRLGAVLVGEPTPAGLVFRGRVGSGLGGKAGPILQDLLLPLTRTTSPFCDEVPRVDRVGVSWVEPRVVVDVDSLGLSRDGRLRQPSYRGTRIDLTPEDLLADLTGGDR